MKITILGVASAVILLAGCHHNEQTYSTPQGNVTVKQDTGSSTITANGTQGNTTVTTQGNNMTGTTTDASGKKSTVDIGSHVDMSDLGVKLYPGATPKDNSTVKTDTPDGSSMAVQLDTKDDATKVIDFYKGEMKVESTMTTAQGGLITGTTPEGAKVVISISKVDTGNTISITVVKKKKQ